MNGHDRGRVDLGRAGTCGQQLLGRRGRAVLHRRAGTAFYFGHLLQMGSPENQALAGGFQWAFWVCGAIALAAIPVALLLVRDTLPAPAAAPALALAE